MTSNPKTIEDKRLDYILDARNFYSEAVKLLSKEAQEFYETTSWAGELHQEAIRKLQREAILADLSTIVRDARIDELKRAASHNNSEYTSDYLEDRIKKLKDGLEIK